MEGILEENLVFNTKCHSDSDMHISTQTTYKSSHMHAYTHGNTVSRDVCSGSSLIKKWCFSMRIVLRIDKNCLIRDTGRFDRCFCWICCAKTFIELGRAAFEQSRYIQLLAPLNSTGFLKLIFYPSNTNRWLWHYLIISLCSNCSSFTAPPYNNQVFGNKSLLLLSIICSEIVYLNISSPRWVRLECQTLEANRKK